MKRETLGWSRVDMIWTEDGGRGERKGGSGEREDAYKSGDTRDGMNRYFREMLHFPSDWGPQTILSVIGRHAGPVRAIVDSARPHALITASAETMITKGP